MQKWVAGKTRLGIPVMFHEEGLHGDQAPGSTSFPVPIALASTWNPALVERIYGVVAKEIRARGAQQVLTPVLDLARDPRWGRVEETFGEDAYLVSRMGVATIRGFQGGPGPAIDRDHIFATAKHFAVHGPPENGTNAGPGNDSEGHGLLQRVDGVPSHANRWLLDQVLRREWGLRDKFLAGLFENPYTDPGAAKIVNSAEHRALAAETARQATILLKNDTGVLPLDRTKIKSIAVIGPNAAKAHLGSYSDNPGHTVSILEGIQRKAGGAVEIAYAEGCRITKQEADWNADRVEPADPALDAKLIPEAVRAARQADVALVVVGNNESTSREAWSNIHLGDRETLSLLGRQEDLVKAVMAAGKPVIVILVNGSPLAISWIAEHVPAILEGWYLGEETGTAVADVLFGDYNPGGRLPVTGPALGGAVTRVLELQAVHATRLHFRHDRATVPVRPRPELHHV